jgi:hypothetical protein
MKGQNDETDGLGGEARWLLLVHQLPAKPPYLRVKIWRRLQALGAVSVKNSVYALPAGDQGLEDFQWLLREIEQGGGEGMIWEANLVDGLNDQEVRALFDAAREVDYAELAKELRHLAANVERLSTAQDGEKPDIKGQLVRLRRRYAEVSGIDFYGATGRMTVEALLSDLEGRLVAATGKIPSENAMVPTPENDLIGKTWVTRRDVHVDRMACAWLIRRFIDPAARFKFVMAKNYAAHPGELRFDLFNGEFTHEGDMCSFEVFVRRLGIDDPALRAIAEIVHDIDLKDGKFDREQTAGIAHVIAGICMSHKDDLARIDRGSALFDDTYEYFRKKPRR